VEDAREECSTLSAAQPPLGWDSVAGPAWEKEGGPENFVVIGWDLTPPQMGQSSRVWGHCRPGFSESRIFFFWVRIGHGRGRDPEKNWDDWRRLE
jgi:hypothetical protein